MALGQRVLAGMGEVRVAGDLRGKPAVILHGRADALLPANHISRPYTAFSAPREPGSRLRYYELTDTDHFGAPVGLYPRMPVPLHVYNLRAPDLMRAHVTTGASLPPSPVVRATVPFTASPRA